MAAHKLLILFLSLFAATAVLASPHMARSAHHRALAGRAPVPVPIDSPALPIRRRKLSKRCKPRSPPALVQSTITATRSAKPTAQHNPPVTTSHYQAPPAQPTSGDSGSNSDSTLSGDGTFYGTGLGACGITNQDSDFIVAVSHDFFDDFPGYNRVNPNTNPICGKKVKATYQGKTVTVEVTDRCTGCAREDLDFSPAAFNKLADPAKGRIFGVKWSVQ